MKYNMNKREFGCVNWSSIYYAVFLIILVHIQGLNSLLHCYRCLALECPASKETCKEVRQFIVSELKTFYYFASEDLEPCPKPDDALAWRIAQLEDSCCASHAQCPHVTCTLGRLRVITETVDSSSNIISHGTVLGCANEHLLTAMRDAKKKNNCDMQNINSTSKLKAEHYLSLEHCNQNSDTCYDADFCIDHTLSGVKTFKDLEGGVGSFNFGIAIGIIATIVIVILAIMAASLCWGPLNSAHNFSKQIEPVSITGFADIETPSVYPNSTDTGSSSTTLVTRKASAPSGPPAVPVPIPQRPEHRSSYI